MAQRTKSASQRLLAWYEAERRDLPWRHSRDPWAIWVSEVMLQQTRVEVVAQAFPAFLQRFPDPAALAAATDDELLAAWQGLGYYRRARLLRAGAARVAADHGGQVPSALAALRDLPGIGAYTAGAIASIAFGARAAAVDGNVERVVARHECIEDNIKQRTGAARVREVVDRWMPKQRVGDFNQALMELGATVCTPRNPRCSACPIETDCAARAADCVADLPRLPERRRAVDVVTRAVLVPVSEGRVLGTRVPGGSVNQGQIELPGPGILIGCATTEDLGEALRQRYGTNFEIGAVVTTVAHAITHHRIRLVVHEARGGHGPGPNLMAARPDDPRVPWTTAARKVFAQAALFLAARD